MIDLGALPGDSCSLAYYVNSHGQVVGTSESRELCTLDEAVGEHAFLWELGRPMGDLNTLIPPGARLNLSYALAINEQGEIAGFGLPPGCAPEDYEACRHAYLLIPCGLGEECVNTTLGTAGPSATSSPFSLKRTDAQIRAVDPWDGFRNHLRRRFQLGGQHKTPKG